MAGVRRWDWAARRSGSRATARNASLDGKTLNRTWSHPPPVADDGALHVEPGPDAHAMGQGDAGRFAGIDSMSSDERPRGT